MTTQDMNTTDALRAILDNLEAEQALKKQNDTIAYLNQPDKLAISSNDGEQAQVTYNGQFQNAFYNFTVSLPRPVVNVKTLELLSANIPQAQVNIPDESLIFFYYRIQTYTNNVGNQTFFQEEPDIDTINYVRLLPSYYKQELVQEYPTLGFNRTFANYADLATELAKACANDLIYEKTTGAYGTFIPNDISITYNEDINKFQMTGNNADEPWTPPTYTLNPASIVQENELVTYQSQEYLSLQNNNPVNPALIIYTYSSGQVFKKFNIALYNGIYYTCVVSEVSNVLPTNTTYWSFSLYYPATAYPIGFNVYYSNFWYVAISESLNIDNTPSSSPLYWRLQPFTTPNVMNWWQVYTGTTGYTYLSAGYEDPVVFEFAQDIQELSSIWDFDFNGLDPIGYDLFSIPPQPIAQYQTLNLRLGFTWDGIYTWSYDTKFTGIIKDVYRNGSVPAMLFNRLRPVPLYKLSLSPGLGLGTPIDYGDPYIATTYTADAFANLVYSSVVSIYTSIIGPSTTDTQRNTNLLSIVPMDCNNLGVTFYQPTISNKYNRVMKDIYQIYFEFRREDGEPYYFSNNAIITIQLGLTY
jgi:hypothetical protein